MSTTCKINLDNKLNVFYSGQGLCGTAVLSLAEHTIVHGVYVQLYGVANVKWMECNKPISQNKIYLNKKFYVFGSEGGRVSRNIFCIEMSDDNV